MPFQKCPLSSAKAVILAPVLPLGSCTSHSLCLWCLPLIPSTATLPPTVKRKRSPLILHHPLRPPGLLSTSTISHSFCSTVCFSSYTQRPLQQRPPVASKLLDPRAIQLGCSLDTSPPSSCSAGFLNKVSIHAQTAHHSTFQWIVWAWTE